MALSTGNFQTRSATWDLLASTQGLWGGADWLSSVIRDVLRSERKGIRSRGVVRSCEVGAFGEELLRLSLRGGRRGTEATTRGKFFC